jgi:dynein heavy chain
LNNVQPEYILEDVKLIDTLNVAKETSNEVKEILAAATLAMKKINETREVYRPCGKQAAILFFVLNDLNKINTMYQFSLDWYKQLFSKSITDSASDNIGSGQGGKERVDAINTHHTKFVYTTVCRSLFESHKLLLSMQMCIRLQMAGENPPNKAEWNYFLKGGEVMDRAAQPAKPQGTQAEWLTQ